MEVKIRFIISDLEKLKSILSDMSYDLETDFPYEPYDDIDDSAITNRSLQAQNDLKEKAVVINDYIEDLIEGVDRVIKKTNHIGILNDYQEFIYNSDKLERYIANNEKVFGDNSDLIDSLVKNSEKFLNDHDQLLLDIKNGIEDTSIMSDKRFKNVEKKMEKNDRLLEDINRDLKSTLDFQGLSTNAKRTLDLLEDLCLSDELEEVFDITSRCMYIGDMPFSSFRNNYQFEEMSDIEKMDHNGERNTSPPNFDSEGNPITAEDESFFSYDLDDEGNSIDETNFTITTSDGEKVHITLGVPPAFHTRIDTDTISSKEECYEIMDEICQYLRENYPTIEIDGVQYNLSSMSNNEICLLIYGDTYANMVAELWGHANVFGTILDLGTKRDSTSQADLNKGDRSDDERFENNIIKEFGGGNPNYEGK